ASIGTASAMSRSEATASAPSQERAARDTPRRSLRRKNQPPARVVSRREPEDVPDRGSEQWYGGPGRAGRPDDSTHRVVRPATTQWRVWCGPDRRVARPPPVDGPDRSLDSRLARGTRLQCPPAPPP